MELDAPFGNSGAECARVHKSKDEAAIFSEELKAGGMMLAKITFVEDKCGFECMAVGVRGHVYHFYVVWPNMILCDNLQG
jgi:hypothetical protein